MLVELSNGKIASGSEDRTIKIWDPNTGKSLHTLEGHTGVDDSIIELSDGKIASCSMDNTIKIWDTNTWECLRTLEGHTRFS